VLVLLMLMLMLQYEVAALRPPFDATSHPSLMQKINAGRFCRIPDRYSDALFNVIRAMLERDPTRRPGFEQLEKEASATLSPYLREARAIVHEYNNTRKHHER
jgi:serine/threonine protein kinase